MFRSSRSRTSSTSTRRFSPRRSSATRTRVSANAAAPSSCCGPARRSISPLSRAYMADHKVAKQYWPERRRDRRRPADDPGGQDPEVPAQGASQGVRRRPAEGQRVSQRFAGRVCVVTGAARGIGFSIAERLGREGGLVAALDVSARRLEPAVEELRAKGVEVRADTSSTSATVRRCVPSSSVSRPTSARRLRCSSTMRSGRDSSRSPTSTKRLRAGCSRSASRD